MTCTFGTLAGAGGSATITINATAPNDTCPTITKQATGTHAGGTIPASGTVSTTVTDCAGPTPEASVLIQKTNDANDDGIFSSNEESKNDGRDVDRLLRSDHDRPAQRRVHGAGGDGPATPPPGARPIVNVTEVCVMIVGGRDSLRHEPLEGSHRDRPWPDKG